jgi:hypothetical protein
VDAVAQTPRSRFTQAVALDGLGRSDEALALLEALRDDPEGGGYSRRAMEVLDAV